MERKQINLGFGIKPLEKNIEFLNKFFQTERLEKQSRYFTKSKDVGAANEIDTKMTLEKYFDLIGDNFHFVLQLGWYSDDIMYCVKGFDSELKSRLAWVVCPFNEHNYQVTSDIFKEIYNEEI